MRLGWSTLCGWCYYPNMACIYSTHGSSANNSSGTGLFIALVATVLSARSNLQGTDTKILTATASYLGQ